MDTIARDELEAARNRLATVGISIEAGVRDQEITMLEAKFHFRFPPDLRWFVNTGIPTGKGFPNWHELDDALLDQLQWPVRGICFDITHGTFWWPDWGLRPDSTEGAVGVAMERLSKLPPLIPIYGHSYLSSDPPNAGNPVFSVYQSDVIHRGRNLGHYLRWILHDDSDDSIEL